MSTGKPAAPAAVIDVLNGLLEAEMNSVFRFMGEGYPYLNRATAEVRTPLRNMVVTQERRVMDLATLIDNLSGVPVPGPRGIDPEEQYLAFLSLKFLLPKLVDAKKLMIERYENALRNLSGADSAVVRAVGALRDEHKSQLQALNQAAAHVAAMK